MLNVTTVISNPRIIGITDDTALLKVNSKLDLASVAIHVSIDQDMAEAVLRRLSDTVSTYPVPDDVRLSVTVWNFTAHSSLMYGVETTKHRHTNTTYCVKGLGDPTDYTGTFMCHRFPSGNIEYGIELGITPPDVPDDDSYRPTYKIYIPVNTPEDCSIEIPNLPTHTVL